jgi:hypothetical protein
MMKWAMRRALLALSAAMGCGNSNEEWGIPPTFAPATPPPAVGTSFGTGGAVPSFTPIPVPTEEPSEGFVGVDAGPSPGTDDADYDGCPDAAEAFLGGCTDPTDAIVVAQCYSGAGADEAVFIVPGVDAGVVESVTLVTPLRDVPLIVEPLLASPAGAVEIRGTSFSNVPVGTEVRFLVGLAHEITTPVTLSKLYLVSGDGEVLATGDLLIVSDYPCPLVI